MYDDSQRTHRMTQAHSGAMTTDVCGPAAATDSERLQTHVG